MEKLIVLTVLVLLFIAASAVWLFANPSKMQETTTTTAQASTSSTTSLPLVTTSVVTTSTPAQTTSTSTSSTTTLPRYVILNVTGVEKCKETVLGKMNRLYVDLPASLGEKWSVDPLKALLFSCDDHKMLAPERVVYKGGNTVERWQDLPGNYRLMVKCGRNGVLLDLIDCREITAYFDTYALQNTTVPQPPS